MVIREFKPMYRGWVYESMLGNILLASAIPIIKKKSFKNWIIRSDVSFLSGLGYVDQNCEILLP